MVYELAERKHGGIIVRLLWDSIRDEVIVRYRDRATYDAFVAVVPKSDALKAFRHPNAYRTGSTRVDPARELVPAPV